MFRLSSLAFLTLIACPGPVDETPDASPPSDAGSAVQNDSGSGVLSDGGQAEADAGDSPAADTDGGVVVPDAGPAAPDAGGEPELSDVFFDNPMGTYELLDLWIDDGEGPPPEFSGLVFADNGATAMMADLSECIPVFVFAEWRLNGEGQLLTYEGPDDAEGDLILGAVSGNGNITIQFPGGGAVMRRVRTDCHTMESHVGAWQMAGEAPDQPMTVVLTEREEYVVMLSDDPCFPLMSTTYDLAGPWLRVGEGPDGGEMGDPIGMFVKRDRLILGGADGGEGEEPPVFERIDRCEDGGMSPPPQALVGTYQAGGNNPPAPFMALDADGQLTLLAEVSPCTAVSSGAYTANNTVFGYRVGEQTGMGRYTMEGANITVYQGIQPDAPVWLNLNRVRSACH